ncbi:MAG TPA: hypothetical protein VMV26_02395 [Alphaproteobacteria bacterium]|nr:hypothetical protein [Alphaproteobacteria bacterium]
MVSQGILRYPSQSADAATGSSGHGTRRRHAQNVSGFLALSLDLNQGSRLARRAALLPVSIKTLSQARGNYLPMPRLTLLPDRQERECNGEQVEQEV